MRWNNFLGELGSMRASPCGPSKPSCFKKGGAVKKFGKGGMPGGAGPAPAGASATFSSSGSSDTGTDQSTTEVAGFNPSKQSHNMSCAYAPVKSVGEFYGTRPRIQRIPKDNRKTGAPLASDESSTSNADSFETAAHLNEKNQKGLRAGWDNKKRENYYKGIKTYLNTKDKKKDYKEKNITNLGSQLGVRVHPGDPDPSKIRKQIKKGKPVMLTTTVENMRGAGHSLTAIGHSRKGGKDYLKIHDPAGSPPMETVEYKPSASSSDGYNFKTAERGYKNTRAWRTRPKP